MDAGTAKPSRSERERVRHHLIDILDPDERYSAGRFRGDAIRAVEEILARKRIPLLVGGTMLYYRALAAGLDALPAADPETRRQIDAEAARRGWPAMHSELARIDPQAAARIASNDPQRIQRALEVFRISGRSISSLQTATAPSLPFGLRAFAIMPTERAVLHQRIAQRFDRILKSGLIDELKSLRQRYALSAELPSMRCVGYRQAWGYLEGEYGEAEMRDKAIAATRQLAKRQMTWIRSFKEVELLAEPAAADLEARMR
jgi:tRNA dimethylallyltransferase